ncbi:DUF2461 domain-containing protein [Specibacter cremeus]|uniref:DUF2461 domain-containing protein n=1 Tax=Specibacter cremeus TaxID=1629051 RepID=UPI000F78A584|nr:DUF2461 domain-containing protein [Specibacter cremeus]
METTAGIPAAAFDFYARLEQNNNRDWWLAHKESYDDDVRVPLLALLAQLEPLFGPARVFRPYRDTRFSADKTPYKTSQGAHLSNHEGVGFYLRIGAGGLMLGGGFHSAAPAHLARYRTAVDASVSGEALALIVETLRAAGFEPGPPELKQVPRGFPRDHPRAVLLRCKTLSASTDLGVPDWLDTADAAHRIATELERLRPLVDWVLRYATP